MVVFTCNHCGESIQKPKVAKHYQTTCRRNSIALTCVDCFKDFNLQEYVVHTRCITEDEKYSAKGTQPVILKGEVKQTEWMNTINMIIKQQQNVEPSIKNILETLQSYNNVPRKKAKFFNFMKSTFRSKFNMRHIEQVWDLLEAQKIAENKSKQRKVEPEKTENEIKQKEKSKTKKSEETVENGTNGVEKSETKTKKKRKSEKHNNGIEEIPEKKQKSNEENGTDISSKKKKKKKSSTDETESKIVDDKNKNSECEEINNSKLEDNQNESFSFKQTIIDILTKKSKGLSKEALQKKVFKKYKVFKGPIENDEILLKKYHKKLKALKNVTYDNDKYKITSE